MRLWGYYAFHTFINSVRKIFRSTFIIVMAIIIGIGVVVGAAAGIIVTALEDDYEGTEDGIDAEDREGYADPEYGFFNENGSFIFYDDLIEDNQGGFDENGNYISYEDALEQGLGYYDEFGDFVFYYEEMTEEDIAMVMLAVESAVALLVILLLGFGVHSGMKKGSDIFTMADVNFMFTAPIRPQSVLLFRLTFQMIGTIMGSIYLLFQIPNLVINVGVPLDACLMIFGIIIVTLMLQKLVSVGMYTVTATHEKIQKYVTPLLIGLVGILVVWIGGTFLATGMDLWKTLELTLSSGWTRWIPFIGWTKAMVVYAVEGNLLMVFLFTALTVVGSMVFIYGIWHIKADFYEDAMNGAQARADVLLAASENRKVVDVQTNTDGKKKKDKRKAEDEKNTAFGKAIGAPVFLFKEILVRRRLAKLGLITNTMLWYLVICAGMAVLQTKLLEIEQVEFTITGAILMFVLFFRNYGNPIAQETAMNWLFLIPESPYKKVFFAMMAGTYATFMDLLPGMVIAMVISNLSPISMLLWMVTLVTMDFMLSGVGMMLEALFPATALDVVKAMIQMMLKFAMIMVIAIVFVVGMLLGDVTMALWLNIIMNVLLGTVCFLIYPSMLHGGIS